jgi:hypothetical protein
MPFFRKKPVVIEAEKLVAGMQGDLLSRAIVEGKARTCEDDTVLIQTLECSMIGRPGDWLLRGVKGEFYPCKPDIFAATYEPAQVA